MSEEGNKNILKTQQIMDTQQDNDLQSSNSSQGQQQNLSTETQKPDLPSVNPQQQDDTTPGLVAAGKGSEDLGDKGKQIDLNKPLGVSATLRNFSSNLKYIKNYCPAFKGSFNLLAGQKNVGFRLNYLLNHMNDKGVIVNSVNQKIPHSLSQDVKLLMFSSKYKLNKNLKAFGTPEMTGYVDRSDREIFEGKPILESEILKYRDNVEFNSTVFNQLDSGNIDFKKILCSKEWLISQKGLAQRIALCVYYHKTKKFINNTRLVHLENTERRPIRIEQLSKNPNRQKEQILKNARNGKTIICQGKGHNKAMLFANFIRYTSTPIVLVNNDDDLPRCISHNPEDETGEILILTDNVAEVNALATKYDNISSLFLNEKNLIDVIEYWVKLISKNDAKDLITSIIKNYMDYSQFDDSPMYMYPVSIPFGTGLYKYKGNEDDGVIQYGIYLNQEMWLDEARKSVLHKSWVLFHIQNELNQNNHHSLINNTVILNEQLNIIKVSFQNLLLSKNYYDAYSEAFGREDKYEITQTNRHLIQKYVNRLTVDEYNTTGGINRVLSTPDSTKLCLALFTPDNNYMVTGTLGELLSGNIPFDVKKKENGYLDIKAFSMLELGKILANINYSFMANIMRNDLFHIIGKIDSTIKPNYDRLTSLLAGSSFMLKLTWESLEIDEDMDIQTVEEVTRKERKEVTTDVFSYDDIVNDYNDSSVGMLNPGGENKNTGYVKRFVNEPLDDDSSYYKRYGPDFDEGDEEKGNDKEDLEQDEDLDFTDLLPDPVQQYKSPIISEEEQKESGEGTLTVTKKQDLRREEGIDIFEKMGTTISKLIPNKQDSIKVDKQGFIDTTGIEVKTNEEKYTERKDYDDISDTISKEIDKIKTKILDQNDYKGSIFANIVRIKSINEMKTNKIIGINLKGINEIIDLSRHNETVCAALAKRVLVETNIINDNIMGKSEILIPIRSYYNNSVKTMNHDINENNYKQVFKDIIDLVDNLENIDGLYMNLKNSVISNISKNYLNSLLLLIIRLILIVLIIAKINLKKIEVKESQLETLDKKKFLAVENRLNQMISKIFGIEFYVKYFINRSWA